MAIVTEMCRNRLYHKTTNGATSPVIIEWEYTGSNRGPSACKADALNQLSYTPNIFISILSSNRGPWRETRHALNQLSYAPF